MRDRLERLEALGRLRSSGTLSEEEFAAEKARILGGAEAGRPSPRLWWFGGAAGLAVVGATGLALLGWNAADRTASAPTAARPASRPTPAPTPTSAASPTPSPPEPIAMDATLRHSSPSECIAGGDLARLYGSLDRAMEKGRGSSVSLAALPEPLAIEATNGTEKDGTWTASAKVRFPDRTYWHSLRLSRVAAEWVRPPETDSLYGRAMTFLDPPKKVLAVLNRLGFDAKPAPGWSELPDTYNSCGGAMEVKPIPGGTSLSCGWGC